MAKVINKTKYPTIQKKRGPTLNGRKIESKNRGVSNRIKGAPLKSTILVMAYNDRDKRNNKKYL